MTLASPDELFKLDLYGTLKEKHVRLTPAQLRLMYADVRERTNRTLSGLTPEQLRAVPEPSLNPFDWGLGHIAHFYEFMILKLLAPDAAPVLPGHDVHALFDSFRSAHGDRWKPRDVVGTDPTLDEVRSYLADVTGSLADMLGPAGGPADDEPLDPVSTYLHVYGVVHEHWHVEDFIQTRHTLRYSQPPTFPTSPNSRLSVADAWGGSIPVPVPVPVPAATPVPLGDVGEAVVPAAALEGGAHPGYVAIPAGRYLLGANKEDKWVFDAERWAHEVEVPAFRIARAPVTNGGVRV